MDSITDEPVLDSRTRIRAAEPSQHEIEDHRSQNSMCIRLPPHRFQADSSGRSGTGSTRNRRRRRQKERRQSLSGILEEDACKSDRCTDPSHHVMFLLGEDYDETEEPHNLFCELDQFTPYTMANYAETGVPGEWKEVARWIKFEEDVEEGGERWSKPHVATLSLYSLFEVRNCLATGTVILNMEATTLEQVVEFLLNKLEGDGQLKHDRRSILQEILLLRHSHLHEKKYKPKAFGSQIPLIRSMADIGRKHSSRDVDKEASGLSLGKSGSSAVMEPHLTGLHLGDPATDSSLHHTETAGSELNPSPSSQKFDLHFMKKIPPGAEASNIWVGEYPNLEQQVVGFIRLKEATLLGEVTEVPVPTRFIFFLLGPPSSANGGGSPPGRYHEVGRCMGTLMSDEVFHDVAYKAKTREDLLAGIDEFLSSSTVLPPGEWDPSIRIEPPKSVPCQDVRKTGGTTGGMSNGLGSVPHNLANKGEESDTGGVSKSGSVPGMGATMSVVVPITATTTTASAIGSGAGGVGGVGGGGSGGNEKNAIGSGISGGSPQPPSADKVQNKALTHAGDEGAGESHFDESLERTGRLFGGLVEDIKRRYPHYLTDITDAFHIQCFASFFFLYFACLTPIITFGGLLSTATDGYLGAMESILSGAVVGVTYSLFSGQPLTIMGSTGPVLVFENIINNLCKSQGWDYLNFRLWIGLWLTAFLLIIVAFDLSSLVKFITRFTEESFAALIALIFIVEAFKKTYEIQKKYPIDRFWYPDRKYEYNCSCFPSNLSYPNIKLDIASKLLPEGSSFLTYDGNNTQPIAINFTAMGEQFVSWEWKEITDYCKLFGGKLVGDGCTTGVYSPDVFFFSCLLVAGTFVLSYGLKMMRNSSFFPNKVRSLISDFAVMIAISLMTSLDFVMGFHTPKLNVPRKFAPTLGYKTRGWWIPLFSKNPFYTVFLAIGPALLATILIFMDQQITAVIVNRKENKLKKGCGYHLDLLIVAILICACSFIGIPWFVAATVLSINHVMSLKKESENTAPGEVPVFLGCREQRVTGVVIFLTIGLSVFLTPILRLIPMPVLFGVFLFMGVASLRGVQLMQRISLFFMPVKYQPDYIFLRHVPILRVHLFTIIQATCLGMLWVIKSISALSILFPIMVLAMCFIRKALELIFSHNELRWLDDIMPEMTIKPKKKQPSLQDAISSGDIEIRIEGVQQSTDQLTFKPNEKPINISEEMSKTAIWRQMSNNTQKPSKETSKARKSNKSSRQPIAIEVGEDIPLKTATFTAGDDDDSGDNETEHRAPEFVIHPPSASGSPDLHRRAPHA